MLMLKRCIVLPQQELSSREPSTDEPPSFYKLIVDMLKAMCFTFLPAAILFYTYLFPKSIGEELIN